jgi:hypothetical protein
MKEEELEDLLRMFENDCPDDLVKLAKTPFEKAVTTEFLKLYQEVKQVEIEQEVNFKWLKWLTCGIFSVVGFSLLFEVIRFILHI